MIDQKTLNAYWEDADNLEQVRVVVKDDVEEVMSINMTEGKQLFVSRKPGEEWEEVKSVAAHSTGNSAFSSFNNFCVKV